jgi:uncharacterized ion transporter superfamily protein YfcC
VSGDTDDINHADGTEGDRRKAAIARIENRRAFWQHLVTYVVVNTILVVIWAVSGAGYFWPIWIIGFWGIGLVLHAWQVFGQKPISEDDIRREMGRGGA